MNYSWRTVVLFTSLTLGLSPAWAQSLPAGNPTPDNKAQPPVSSSKVPADAAVVTIDGLCGSDPYSIAQLDSTSKVSSPSDSKTSGPQTTSAVALDAKCKTIITRSQFEKLAVVVAPNQPPQAGLQLAHFYADQLLFARKARELGLDKDPNFDEILKFTYLQVLARMMNNHLQQQAEMPDAEFEKYYKEHSADFEEVQLLQISIPKRKQQASDTEAAPPPKVDNAADEAAMKAEAEKIYSQVLAGGDFEKLQDEAYVVAGDPDDTPDSDMGMVTRRELGDTQAEIFAMQPGQVSKLISGSDAWHIFKVVSKQMMSPSDAKRMVAGKRRQALTEALKNSVKPQFNDAFFVPAADAEQATAGKTP